MTLHTVNYTSFITRKLRLFIITLAVLSSCSTHNKDYDKTVSLAEKKNAYEQNLASCVNTCLNLYKVAMSSCNYLVSGDKKLQRKHADYAKCLQRKGFNLGEETCKKGCASNSTFYLK